MKKQVADTVQPISFKQAIYNFWTKYIDFRGTATRREYWYCWLFILVVNVLFSFTGAIIGSIVGAIILLPRWSVSVRRFHDVGVSEWLYMIPAVAVLVWFAVRSATWLRWIAMGYFSLDFMIFVLIMLMVFVFNTIVFLWPSRVEHVTVNKKQTRQKKISMK